MLALATAGALAAAATTGGAATAKVPAVHANGGKTPPGKTAAGARTARRAPPGKVIWAGDAESPSSREWATGNAFDVNRGNATSMLSDEWDSTSRVRRVSSPVAQGASAYAVTVRAGDRDAYSSDAQRTEIGQNNTARRFPDGVERQMTQGQERWIALQLRIPADYPGARWNTLIQLKGEGSGNGPFSVDWEDGRVMLKKSESQRYGSTNIDTVWSPSRPTGRDRWIKLLFHVNWSTGSDGHYELFGDLGDGRGFHRLKSRTGGWTLKQASGGGPVEVGARFGIYRSAIAKDATAYFDGFNVARTRADATRRAFGKKQ